METLPASIDVSLAEIEMPVAPTGIFGVEIVAVIEAIGTSLGRTGEMMVLPDTLRVLIETSHSVTGTTPFLSRNMQLRATGPHYRPRAALYFAVYSEDAGWYSEDGGWYSEDGGRYREDAGSYRAVSRRNSAFWPSTQDFNHGEHGAPGERSKRAQRTRHTVGNYLSGRACQDAAAHQFVCTFL